MSDSGFFETRRVAVTTEPVPIDARSRRTSLIVSVLEATNAVYVSADPGVDLATAFPLYDGDVLSLRTQGAVYCRTDTGEASLAVLEEGA